MLMLWTLAVTPGVTHFRAYHPTIVPHFFSFHLPVFWFGFSCSDYLLLVTIGACCGTAVLSFAWKWKVGRWNLRLGQTLPEIPIKQLICGAICPRINMIRTLTHIWIENANKSWKQIHHSHQHPIPGKDMVLLSSSRAGGIIPDIRSGFIAGNRNDKEYGVNNLYLQLFAGERTARYLRGWGK